MDLITQSMKIHLTVQRGLWYCGSYMGLFSESFDDISQMCHGSGWWSVIRAQYHSLTPEISPSLLLPERPRRWGEIACASVPNPAAADSGTFLCHFSFLWTKNKLMANLLERANKAWCQNKNLSLLFLDDNIYKHTNSNCRIKWFLSS